MARYDIWNLEIPEAAEDHIWDRHQIAAELVDSVLEGAYVVIRNRSNRAGNHLLTVAIGGMRASRYLSSKPKCRGHGES